MVKRPQRRRAPTHIRPIFSLIYRGMHAGRVKATRINAKLNRTMRPARLKVVFPSAAAASQHLHFLTQQLRKARRDRALQERVQGVFQ